MDLRPDTPYAQYRKQVRRFHEGHVGLEEFAGFFDLFDEDPRYPSLGVNIVVRFPQLALYYQGSREWLRMAGPLAHTDKALRAAFDDAVAPDREYADDKTAYRVLAATADLHRVMIVSMLLLLGLRKARNWERIAGFKDELGLKYSIVGEDAVLSYIILDYLKTAHIDDIILFMGGNPEGTAFDSSNLIAALDKYKKAAAAICATRAPELFLYRGRCFGLSEDDLNVLCLLIGQDGGYLLSPEQKKELLAGDSIPLDARESFRDRWKM